MKRLLLALGGAALLATATAPAFAQSATAHPVVQLKTSQGDIRVGSTRRRRRSPSPTSSIT